MKLGRRDFLKGLGGFVAGLLSSVKVKRPPGDNEQSIPATEKRQFPIAKVDPVYWKLAAESNGAPSSFCVPPMQVTTVENTFTFPLTDEEWFEECADLIYEEAMRLNVPMSTREIKCHSVPRSELYPGVYRFVSDWYDGDRRYGFAIKWRGPSPREILEAARPTLEAAAGLQPWPQSSVVWLE